MGCRAIEKSRKWDVAQLKSRANGMSRNWEVAQVGCRADGISRNWNVAHLKSRAIEMSRRWDIAQKNVAQMMWTHANHYRHTFRWRMRREPDHPLPPCYRCLRKNCKYLHVSPSLSLYRDARSIDGWPGFTHRAEPIKLWYAYKASNNMLGTSKI